MKFTGLGGRLYRGETSINIINARKKWYALSGVFVALSIFALGVQGLHLGIEFKGGSAFTVTTASGTVEEARSVVSSTGYTGNTIVQTIGNDKIRIQTGVLEPAESNAIQDALAAKFGVTVESIDTQNGQFLFVWKGSDNDTPAESLSYEIYLGEDFAKVALLDTPKLKAETASLTVPVQSGKIYYWMVKTMDAKSASYSAIYSFRVN